MFLSSGFTQESAGAVVSKSMLAVNGISPLHLRLSLNITEF